MPIILSEMDACYPREGTSFYCESCGVLCHKAGIRESLTADGAGEVDGIVQEGFPWNSIRDSALAEQLDTLPVWACSDACELEILQRHGLPTDRVGLHE